LYLISSGIDWEILGSILLSLIWPVAHGVLMISAIYYRLKGIRL